MLRSLLLVLLLLLLAVVAAPLLVAQACAATPEAAAQSALGGVVHVSAGAGAGFRVQDVQVDPVLRRVWVRVRRCDNASAPAVLVPLLAPVNNPLQAVAEQAAPVFIAATSSVASALPALPSARVLQEPISTPPVTLVHPGDTVHVVFASSAVHMELEATANQQGGVGDTIQMTLKRRPNQAPDEPEHRMHGTVRADKTVEVQP